MGILEEFILKAENGNKGISMIRTTPVYLKTGGIPEEPVVF